MTEDIRWKQRYTNFKKAGAQLTEFIDKGTLNKFEVQGLFQCFEYTFELAWKVLKDYLNEEGLEVNTPRKIIQESFRVGILNNGHVWIDALQKRNLIAHTYDENFAKQAETLIRESYYPAIIELLATLEDLL